MIIINIKELNILVEEPQLDGEGAALASSSPAPVLVFYYCVGSIFDNEVCPPFFPTTGHVQGVPTVANLVPLWMRLGWQPLHDHASLGN